MKSEKEVVVPEVLYRYRAWGDFAKDIIVNSRIYFCSPNQLNDPFDCKPGLIPPKSKAEFKRFFLEHMTRKKGIKRQVALEQYQKDNRAGKIEAVMTREFMLQRQDVVANEFGICSFSESPDDILLWSHYGDNHHGVCFGFKSVGVFSKVWPVRYRGELVQINLFDSKERSEYDKRETVLVKAKQWQYEKEWRLTRMTASNRFLSFPSSALTTVIVGCLAPESTYKEVLETLKSAGSSARVLRAAKNPTRFSLDLLSE